MKAKEWRTISYTGRVDVVAHGTKEDLDSLQYLESHIRSYIKEAKSIAKNCKVKTTNDLLDLAVRQGWCGHKEFIKKKGRTK